MPYEWTLEATGNLRELRRSWGYGTAASFAHCATIVGDWEEPSGESRLSRVWEQDDADGRDTH